MTPSRPLRSSVGLAFTRYSPLTVAGRFVAPLSGAMSSSAPLKMSASSVLEMPAIVRLPVCQNCQLVQPAGRNGESQLQQATHSGYCLNVGSPRVMRVHMYCEV